MGDSSKTDYVSLAHSPSPALTHSLPGKGSHDVIEVVEFLFYFIMDIKYCLS